MTKLAACLRNLRRGGAAALAAAALAGCTAKAPPLVERSYPPPHMTARGTELGRCSWYGPGFHGKRTASGEVYDQDGMTAAHRTLRLGTPIEVTDLATGRRVQVRVNDRGPYHPDRVLDLSYGAAKQLGTIGRGVANVEIRVLGPTGGAYPEVRYDLQVGAYRNRSEAERLARRLHAGGMAARIERSQTQVYQVRVGPFGERAAAAAAARSLRELGFAPVIVEVDGPGLRPARGAGVERFRYALRTEPSAQAR
jgi:rare lipoprotein A